MQTNLNFPSIICLYLVLIFVASVQCHRNASLDSHCESSAETNSSDSCGDAPRPVRFSTALFGPGPFVSSGVVYATRADRISRQYKGPYFEGSLQPDSPRGYSAERHKLLLDLHNMYRGNVTPPAANMNFLEHDDRLAYLAQIWAERCIFRHGKPSQPYHPGFYGQNLYWGPEWDGVQALYVWYEEFVHYNVRTKYCIPGEQCGHYVAMAYADTLKVGCGTAKCDRNYFHIVCHYFPPVTAGVQMIKIGLPCTQCSYPAEGALCVNNLCVTREQCERNRQACGTARCQLECKNCGRLDSQRCRCDCADGWDSFDCSRRCIDSNPKCGMNPGYYDSRTCPMMNYIVKNELCRKMCSACNEVKQSSTNLCCRGALCEDGYTLENCRCVKTCPGFLCGSASHLEIQLWMKTVIVVNLVVFFTFHIN